MRPFITAVAILAFGPALASAQFPERVQAGVRVRVWIPEQYQQENAPWKRQLVRATVSGIDNDVLRLTVPGVEGTLAVPRSAIRRLDGLGVLINGSFVFGLDGDGRDVFDRTLEFAISRGITTATFHIATPYPGTALYERLEREGRILHHDFDRYDTRQVVFEPRGMTPSELEAGYHRAYREFYTLANIFEASRAHGSLSRSLKHFAYATGWKRFEAAWDWAIRARSMGRARPLLEAVLATVERRELTAAEAPKRTLPLFAPSD